jgi:hypothetical protein
MIIIPCRTDLAHYEMSIPLDGTTFGLEFRWNTREGVWYFDVKTEAGDIVEAGIKVVLDWPLMSRCVDPRRPPGRFLASDTTQRDLAPGLTDLGDRVRLYYVSPDDLTF